MSLYIRCCILSLSFLAVNLFHRSHSSFSLNEVGEGGKERKIGTHQLVTLITFLTSK